MPAREHIETITLPWDEGVRLIAREAANAVIEGHVAVCPARIQAGKNNDTRRLVMRKEFLVGIVIGAAAAGGFMGGFLQKIIP